MRKSPEFRIIGSASKEKKEEVKHEMEGFLHEHLKTLSKVKREELEKFEYPKSEKEIAMIDFANRETNNLMEECGVEPYDIPTENYHIIPAEFYKKVADKGWAAALIGYQAVFFNAEKVRNNLLGFGTSSLHETLHLKGHYAEEVSDKDGKIKETRYRRGVSVYSSQKTRMQDKFHEHFHGLHEGIVSFQERELFPKLLELPEFKKEREWLASEKAKEIRREAAKRRNASEKDVFWVDEDGKHSEILGYINQRHVLDFLCREIQKQFPEQYKDENAVFKEFLKAHFTGRLLPIARLVEKTFGDGSFRMLGSMSEEEESGIVHLEALKKTRLRVLRGK